MCACCSTYSMMHLYIFPVCEIVGVYKRILFRLIVQYYYVAIFYTEVMITLSLQLTGEGHG